MNHSVARPDGLKADVSIAYEMYECVTYGTWLGVVGRDRVVDVDQNARFLQVETYFSLDRLGAVHKNTYVASVFAWEGNKRAGRAASTVLDVDLAARDIELSTTEGRRDVQSNSLHANEVSRRRHEQIISDLRLSDSLARGEFRRQSESKTRHTFRLY